MTKTTKRLTWAGAAALVIVGLTGCAEGSSATSAPVATHAAPAPAVTTTHTMAEQAYLTTVRGLVTNADRVDDATLLHVGTSACKAFASGATYQQILGVMTPSLDDVTAAEMIGAATGTICPEYADRIK